MKYPLHPITLRLLKKGHPWVTKDQYSVKFPKGASTLELKDQQNKSLGVFLNDPDHPRVKARFLAKEVTSLPRFIEWAIKNALKKRQEKTWHRDNYYLCFGEVDQLPGLFIQNLGEAILVQYHAYAWKDYLKLIAKTLRANTQAKYIWTQMRIPGENKKAPQTSGYDAPEEFEITEHDIKYQIKMNLNHDIGIYTDMSAIRAKILPFIKKSESTLNLFSYTGAFTLQALALGQKVTSVDLSKTYMSWLEDNIRLNNFDESKHKSLIGSCQKVLNKLDQQFDTLICDPPSFSSHGKKRESSFDFYKNHWDLLWQSVNPQGHLILFLNTHSITRDKYRKLIKEKLQRKGKIVKELGLSGDCPILPNFPEGDYLKGFVIQKN